MSVLAGGYIKQYIARDPYKRDSWDHSSKATFNLQILNAALFPKITGYAAPKCPISASTYSKLGLPFFQYSETPIPISGDFTGLKSLDDSSGLWRWGTRVVLATSTSSKRFRSVYEMEGEAALAISSADERDDGSSTEEQVKQPDHPPEKKKDASGDAKSSKSKIGPSSFSRLRKRLRKRPRTEGDNNEDDN